VTDKERLAVFIAFSADVTAFTAFELHGTGLADAYLSTVREVVGQDTLDELLAAYDRVRAAAPEKGSARDDGLRRELFSDEKLGPIARNIVKLWYVGTWFELPRAWTETFGAREKNVSFMVSPMSYTEGLLWPAIGANPPGAKGPGYGSWTGPPRIASV
jgi:hypothetical protein